MFGLKVTAICVCVHVKGIRSASRNAAFAGFERTVIVNPMSSSSCSRFEHFCRIASWFMTPLWCPFVDVFYVHFQRSFVGI